MFINLTLLQFFSNKICDMLCTYALYTCSGDLYIETIHREKLSLIFQTIDVQILELN